MACPHAFRPVGRAALGAVRHIFACSRPHHHHHSAMELVESGDSSSDVDTAQMNERSPLRVPPLDAEKDVTSSANAPNAVASKYQSVAELRAVLRHIEVRWQLFNESMSKFHDPEAMLANCTDDVVWSTGSGDVIEGKNQQLLALLRSLIERKVSLEVKIESITRITLSGCADLMLNRNGQCQPVSALEAARTNAALKALRLIDPISQCLVDHQSTATTVSTSYGMPSAEAAPLPSSSSAPASASRPPFAILANDSYVLKDSEGDVAERGRRAVLWQQHRSSWYIRGYLCY